MARVLVRSIALLCVLFVSTLQAASILVGAPANSSNCIPFGCSALYGIVRYQQVYASAAFSGSLLISQVSFFNTYSPGGTDIGSATYTFSLSTTAKAVGGLDHANLDNNVGPDNQVLFSGPLGGPIIGGKFSVSGAPFNYDPTAGNLLLDIGLINPANSSPLTFLDARSNAVNTSRAYTGSSPNSYGLVTEFSERAYVIPEPSTGMLLGLGILGLISYGRYSRRKMRR